jgi:hypothetical protein
MKRTFLLLAAILCHLAANLTAQTVELAGGVVPKTDANKLKIALQLTFQIDGKNKTILLPKEGSPFSPESYVLVDEKKETIPVTPVIDKDTIEQDPPPLLRSITLYPAKDLSEKGSYSLTVKQGVLFFQVVDGSETNTVGNKETTLSISGEADVRPAQDYVEKRQTGKSKVELGAGTPGGVGSIELVYDKSRFLHVDWMNLRVKGNADLTLSEADRADYFNSIVGEAMFYRPVRFANHYSELSVGGKAEADQTFNLVNAGVSAKWAWFVKNGVTDRLGHIFVKDAVSVPPLLVLSYDYLENARDTDSVSGDDESHHRATALVRYQLPISKELDLSALPALGGKFDLSVDFEIKGVYDSTSEKIHDQSWISLVFEKSSGPDRFKPAFSFTWARGKAAPTFQQVSAFFAGLKLSF